MSFSLDILGLRPLIAQLEQFPDRFKPELKEALRAGANIIRDAAKAGVRDGPAKHGADRHQPGALRKSIKTKVGRSRKGYTRMVVTTAGGDSLFSGDTYYGGFREFGHKIGARKLGAARRSVPAYPFIGPAVDHAGPAALAEIESRLTAALSRLRAA